MGVYSIVKENTTTSILDTVEESKCDINLGAAYAIMAENEANYNNILKAIGIAEFNTYEQTGEELIYEAATVEGFIETIKKFFKSLIEKIAGVVRRFKTVVASWTQKDEDFLKNYKAKIEAVDAAAIASLEVEGWVFDDANTDSETWVEGVNTAIAGKVAKCGGYDDLLKLVGKTEDGKFGFEKGKVEEVSAYFEDVHALYGEMTGALVGKGSIPEDELRKELHVLFYGSADKVEIKNIKVSDYISQIEKTKKISDAATANFKKIEGVINEEIKNLDKLKSELKSHIKDDKGAYSTAVSLTNKVTNVVKFRFNLINIRNTAQMQALKDRNTQARAICVKVLAAAGKKAEPKQEGFQHSSSESGTFFDRVKII